MSPKDSRDPIRVLVVDDTATARKVLSVALSDDPQIVVAGMAANGRIALTQIARLEPDIVTLDVTMPEMDGLETLVEIRKRHPSLPVIMVSGLTEHGAVVTIDALSRGAADYVTKPARKGGVAEAVQELRRELVAKIKAICGPKRPAPAELPPQELPQLRSGIQPQAVAIGVSTGGPMVLSSILARLPEDFPVPIFVVQHMPEAFTGFLAQRLDRCSRLTVREVIAGSQPRAGEVWLARGGLHLRVEGAASESRLVTNDEPPQHSCRPAVDVLFQSVAEVFGARAVGVVLTGMGQDGLRGCSSIRRAGGSVIVQDRDSSVVWGMPGAVVASGLADRIVALAGLPEVVCELVGATALPPPDADDAS